MITNRAKVSIEAVFYVNVILIDFIKYLNKQVYLHK